MLENLVISIEYKGVKGMNLNEEMCKVIADLEEIIGSECYNPNSYNGWTDMEGCEFRYPISIPDENGNYEKYRSNIRRLLNFRSALNSEEAVKYMKYKFGSNELFIGLGIIKVLQYLETRYNLDFCELEKKH